MVEERKELKDASLVDLSIILPETATRIPVEREREMMLCFGISIKMILSFFVVVLSRTLQQQQKKQKQIW